MKKLTLLLAAVVVAACTPGATESSEVSSSESGLSSAGRYIVSFRDAARGRSALAAAGGNVALEIHGMAAVAAYLPEEAVAGLRNNPSIEYVEVDALRQPLSQSMPYGISMVQADQVWAAGTRGGNRKVCIIDSGLAAGHEDLQFAAAGKTVAGISGSTAWNTDACGHGTHVAGTIAALDNTLGVVGVNPDGVNLHIVKVFKDDCAWTYASGLTDAVNKCVSAGANVINMSLGGSLKSRTEESALKSAYNSGVLSIAAAGNDGTTRMSYPASYPIVVSVGAVDSAEAWASFSQYNREVDVAAPGVAVLSTVGWKETNSVSAGGVNAAGTYIEGAARGTVSGALAYGGLCDAVGAWGGKVVLCDRGTISFVDKVNNVKAGGGVAAVIANNVSGGFSGTLGDGVTSTLVAIGISMEDGAALRNVVGQTATVTSAVSKPDSGYEAWDGTSMATPHVAGVAALIWSARPTATPAQVRAALEQTAKDLGVAGRDDKYGYGLIQAKAARDYLLAN